MLSIRSLDVASNFEQIVAVEDRSNCQGWLLNNAALYWMIDAGIMFCSTVGLRDTWLKDSIAKQLYKNGATTRLMTASRAVTRVKYWQSEFNWIETKFCLQLLPPGPVRAVRRSWVGGIVCNSSNKIKYKINLVKFIQYNAATLWCNCNGSRDHVTIGNNCIAHSSQMVPVTIRCQEIKFN